MSLPLLYPQTYEKYAVSLALPLCCHVSLPRITDSDIKTIYHAHMHHVVILLFLFWNTRGV